MVRITTPRAPGRRGAGLLVLVLAALPAAAGEPSLSLLGDSDLVRRTGRFVTETCVGLGALGVSPGSGSPVEDLFARCTELVVTADQRLSELLGVPVSPSSFDLGLDPAGLSRALESLAHRQLGAEGSGLGIAQAAVVDTLAMRLASRRAGEGGVRIARGGSMIQIDDLGAAAGSSGGLLSRLGLFLNGVASFGDFDGRGDLLGYDFTTLGVTAGADLRLGDEVVVGFAVDYRDGENDFDRSGGDLDIDTLTAALYGSYERGGFWADLMGAWATSDYRLARHIRFANVDRTAHGKTDGEQVEGHLGFGYDFERGSLRVGPEVRVDYLRTWIDGFEESGAGGLDFAYGSQTADSLTTFAGVVAAYAVSTSVAVLTPQLRVGYEREFADDSRSIRARFRADPNRNTFRIRTGTPDRNYGRVGVGVAATFPGGVAAFADFDALFANRDFDRFTFTVGGRYEF